MKRLLLTLAAALLFVNALVIPTLAHADGNPDGTNCGPNQLCKP
jgi:hypothetical protein